MRMVVGATGRSVTCEPYGWRRDGATIGRIGCRRIGGWGAGRSDGAVGPGEQGGKPDPDDRQIAVLLGMWEHRSSERYSGIVVPVLMVPADGSGRR